MLEVDYYEGGTEVLLVMTGLGSHTKGKYAQIAEAAVVSKNATVFVVATPGNLWDSLYKYNRPEKHIQNVFELIELRMAERGISDYRINAGTHSAGATILPWYAHNYPKVKNVLAINPLLNINAHWMRNGIEHFAGKAITTVWGENDQTAPFIPMLDGIKNPNYKCVIVPGANHNFTGMLDEFIGLFETHLW